MIDDSRATTNVTVNQGGRVFNIVSGSIQSGQADIKTTAASQPGGAFGLFYPDLGILVLHAGMLREDFGISAPKNSFNVAVTVKADPSRL